MKYIYIPTIETAHKQALDMIHDLGLELLDSDNQANAEILIVQTYDKADADFINKYPKLKIILRPAVGIDNIDQNLCKEKNITILNAPGSNANSVAELTVLQILMLLRKANQQRDLIMQNKWRSAEFQGNEIQGKTLGLVGFGNIARLVANKFGFWNLKSVIAYDPFVSKESMAEVGVLKMELDDLLQNADIVSLHLPLLPETKSLFDSTKFNLMKPSAILINDARGELINEEDLINAVNNNVIAGAALDVFTNEPNINTGFKEIDNILITPHIAAYTKEAIHQMWMQPMEKLKELI